MPKHKRGSKKKKKLDLTQVPEGDFRDKVRAYELFKGQGESDAVPEVRPRWSAKNPSELELESIEDSPEVRVGDPETVHSIRKFYPGRSKF